MNEIKRRDCRNFTIRGIIYFIASMILNIKSNTFFTGAATVFIYMIVLLADMRISIKRTMKKLEIHDTMQGKMQ